MMMKTFSSFPFCPLRRFCTISLYLFGYTRSQSPGFVEIVSGQDHVMQQRAAMKTTFYEGKAFRVRIPAHLHPSCTDMRCFSL